MSLFLQFNHLAKNEIARKAMDSYVGFLEKAFEQYRDLWEDYIKLQEKHEQCSVSSLSQITIIEPCIKTKDKLIVESQLNSSITVQESDVNSSLQLDSSRAKAQDIFDDDIEIDLANLSDDFLESSLPKSPVFTKTCPKTSRISAEKIMPSHEKASVYSKSTTDTKMFHKEKVSSKCKQKLDINTAYHVDTTFLPNGKKLKQARLIFYPVKCDKEKAPLFNTSELKSANTIQKTKQNLIDASVGNKPITIEDIAIKTSETFEDVTEISPTQKDIQSKFRRCLKLKRKIPEQISEQIKNYSNKNTSHSFEHNFTTNTAIHDMDLSLCPSPKLTSAQMIHNKFAAKGSNIFKHNINTDNLSSTCKSDKANVDSQGESVIVEYKVQNISQNSNDLYEEETFYLPAEQTNENNTDNFALNDTENKPPARKLLLNKFHESPKKNENVLGQLNMRCKANRVKLDGRDCWECEKYYKNLSLSKEELQKRKNQCSRHRQKYERPNTPEGFWDPEFPDTLSCTYSHNIK